MDIRLNFINLSNDVNNSEIVIFQKNVATDFEELAVAWQVIRNCGQGDNHPFVYPATMTVGASDSYGNFTPQLEAQSSQQFSMTLTQSGDRLTQNNDAASPTEVEILNNLPQGAINAYVFQSGRLLAQKTSIAPGQKAVFQFKPTLWIGVASQVEEGQVINSAVVTSVDTELSLLGIAGADIVMTGGGGGPTSAPFLFTLQNVVMA